MYKPDAQIGNAEVDQRGNVLKVNLLYPRTPPSPIDTVEVDMMEVRACDSIRITYDFARDGWSILQASTFVWDADDKVCDSDWQEVAFVQAWAREKQTEY